MWKMYSKDKIDILKKTQENLEMSQNNTQMLADFFRNHLESSCKDEVIEDVEERKKLAAYALNLCTVSVSQIIDYNDIQFLEYEYDAILNNLNLEKMPKDESLLRILKQLLDVICFFRIQEGDRQMMEKEYEQRVKDAIWSAIPNPTMFVTGGNLLSVGLSLASQVGIGYMNYRKEKAKIAQEKARKEWELQRSAIEQFNGLRRELFDTAWRLADEYKFPDEYRITERQITQYNNILLDTDDMRRFERLEYISKYFKAYAPFWYYLGSAANAVSQDERYSGTVREEHKKKAIENFREFFRLTEQNLLREDQLVASCALELFDLIEEKDEKITLLKKAINASGNAFDVLQICAISYLKIGEFIEACRVLKMLVNEEYNKVLNAQLLSNLYVSKIIEGDNSYIDEYEKLLLRFTQAEYLFPLPKELPKTEQARQELANIFIQKQKENLRRNYACAMRCYVADCENKYNEICRMNGNIMAEIAELIHNVGATIELLVGKDKKNFFLSDIKNSVNGNGTFKKMIEDGDGRSRGKNQVSAFEIWGTAFSNIATIISSQIDKTCDMSEVSILENVLYTFIETTHISSRKADIVYREVDTIEEIFGDKFTVELERSRLVERFISAMKENNFSQQSLVKKGSNLELIVRGDTKFKPYIERNRQNFSVYAFDGEVVAILNDTSMNDIDLIFSTGMVIVTGFWGRKGHSVYKNIIMDRSGEKIVIGEYKYRNSNVDMKVLNEMIKCFSVLANESTQPTYRELPEEVHNIILTGKK